MVATGSGGRPALLRRHNQALILDAKVVAASDVVGFLQYWSHRSARSAASRGMTFLPKVLDAASRWS
jgi:hypothetical protein